MKKVFILAALLVSTTLVTVTALAHTMRSAAEVHVVPSRLHWTQPFGPKGPGFAFVVGKYGDKQPASFFARLKAGGDSGWHFHNEDYSGVVIQGTFTEQQQKDARETSLPVGSYFTQPAKVIHRNGCVSARDCIVFVHFDQGADSIPTTRAGKPLSH